MFLNGANLTLEEYFEFKKEYDDMTKKDKKKLLNDRETFVVYGSEKEDEEGQDEEAEEISEMMDF